ncbi:MAG: peptide chain release factor N(5)-glutamine methyltransferase [Ruminococcaceae bacterium]|nr:peptide chain release factor N(5)-glutamine methyltransferase [Oscillospiraceae bacterium]
MNEREIVLDFYKNDPEGAKKALARLDAGERGAYIIGEWYFWRHIFKLNKDCLIPRPDTECVVEKAIADLPQNAVFADLCTGSGCIALSILSERSDLTALAFDISEGALSAARENAEMLGLSDRISFIRCDLLSEDPLENRLFDAIISNPPYIRAAVVDASPDLSCEPRIALDGGEDGLVFYRRFVRDFAKNLKENGEFIFEIGFDQRDSVTSIAEESALSCKVTRDYGSNDRVAVIKKSV